MVDLAIESEVKYKFNLYDAPSRRSCQLTVAVFVLKPDSGVDDSRGFMLIGGKVAGS